MSTSRLTRRRERPDVVFFTPGYSERGGAPQRVRLLTAELAAQGWDVRVIGRAGTLRAPRVIRADRCTVVDLPGFGSSIGGALYLIIGIPLGCWWARGAKVCVSLHLTSPSTLAAICSLIVRRPHVVMSTRSGLLSQLDYVRASRTAAVRTFLLGRAALLIAQTAEGANELQSLARRGEVTVLPNPVRRVDAPPLTGQPNVVYTGRFAEEKDLVRLLQAWRSVVAVRPQARLRLVGAGGEYRSTEPTLRRLVSEDTTLRRSVTFTGWVGDVARELERADVYVLPSLGEGMSNSMLEACAQRRVIVASDIEPNRAVLGAEYPLLFRAGDTQDLTRALERALEDEDARSRALAAIDERLREFASDQVAARLARMLARVGRDDSRPVADRLRRRWQS